MFNEGAQEVLLDARHVSTRELSGSGTLNVVQGGAHHSGVVHLPLSLTPPLVSGNTESVAATVDVKRQDKLGTDLTPRHPWPRSWRALRFPAWSTGS